MDTMPVSIPGLVWAYRFPPEGGKAIRLQNSALPTELTGGGGFYWLHLNLADARVPALLDTLDGLTADTKAALTTHDTHSAITVDEHMLYGTLVDCQREFDHETADLGWLHFAISDRFIITTRLQPLRSVERARGLLEKNPAKIARPVDLFELLVIEFQRTLISIVMETHRGAQRDRGLRLRQCAARRAAPAGARQAHGRPDPPAPQNGSDAHAPRGRIR
jgi:zinc transporter